MTTIAPGYVRASQYAALIAQVERQTAALEQARQLLADLTAAADTVQQLRAAPALLEEIRQQHAAAVATAGAAVAVVDAAAGAVQAAPDMLQELHAQAATQLAPAPAAELAAAPALYSAPAGPTLELAPAGSGAPGDPSLTAQSDQVGSSVVLAGSGTAPAQIVSLGMAVTKEAPVNIAHPDFAGGVDMTGSTPSDAQLAAAVAYAATAGATGTTAEMYVPSGKVALTARAQFGTVQRLRLFGDGSTSFIQQQTSNEPILEWQAGSSTVVGLIVEQLRLEHAAQQTAAAQPNAAAIRLLTTNVNGFSYNTFRDLTFAFSARGLQWGDGSAQVSFWNNTLEQLYFGLIGGALLRSASSAAVGGPTNYVKRLSSVGVPGVPTEPALALGGTAGTTGGGQWQMDSIDIEDWTDNVISIGGGGTLAISGLHLERHHMVTTNAIAVSVTSVNTVGIFDNLMLAWRIDGAGPFVAFNYSGANGRVSGARNRKDPASSGAGQLRLVAADATSMVELGTYQNEDAQIVNYNPNVIPLPGIRSDAGLPPMLSSGVALPTASATYRNLLLRYFGQSAATADVLYMCLQAAGGTYSWKAVATG